MCDLLSSLAAFATAVKVNSAQCAVLLFFKGSIMTGLPLSLLGMPRLWIWAHNRMATAGAADSQREWWCTHRISQMGGHCTQHVGVVSVCLFITFERVREKLTASSSNDCYRRLRLFESVLAIVIAVYMWQLSLWRMPTSAALNLFTCCLHVKIRTRLC